jgi:hypothetical protein
MHFVSVSSVLILPYRNVFVLFSGIGYGNACLLFNAAFRTSGAKVIKRS